MCFAIISKSRLAYFKTRHQHFFQSEHFGTSPRLDFQENTADSILQNASKKRSCSPYHLHCTGKQDLTRWKDKLFVIFKRRPPQKSINHCGPNSAEHLCLAKHSNTCLQPSEVNRTSACALLDMVGCMGVSASKQGCNGAWAGDLMENTVNP